MGQALTFKQIILNEIDNQPRGFCGNLSSISGYSSSSNFKRVLTDKKREFDNIQGLIELVRYLFSDNEFEMMAKYSKEIDPNNKLARHMLEYLSVNRLLNDMKELLDRMLECKNKESNEWAKVYSLQHEWQVNYYGLDKKEHLKHIRQLAVNTEEMIFFKKLMECYYYYSEGKDNQAHEISQELEFELNTLKNDYIKQNYQTKVNEVLAYINLWVLYNPIQAREKATIVIDSNIGKTFVAFGYYVIGCSYFFTSYERSYDNLLKSKNIYLSINRNDAAEMVDKFIQRLILFWNKNINYDDILNLENKLYFKIKEDKEIEDLEKYEDKIDKAEFLYLSGIKKKDRNILMRSMIHFLKRGDSLFSNLPRIELLKMGENEEVLNDLVQFHLA